MNPTQEQLAAAARILAVLWSLPKTERMDVLAIACRGALEIPRS